MPQNKLHPLLHSSVHILLHPSRTESHPLAVIEAQAMGIPVIGGESSGGVPFTLAHGQAGFLADIRCAQSLSLVMQNVASDPEKRKSLAQKAWDFAHNNFSEDKMVESYLEFYETILAERKGTPTSLL
jgi:glycosyltransferase involved in cell wall biosynthesis